MEDAKTYVKDVAASNKVKIAFIFIVVIIGFFAGISYNETMSVKEVTEENHESSPGDLEFTILSME